MSAPVPKPRVAVNLGLVFGALPWPQRFAAAATTGYDVEFPWPPLPPAQVADLVRRAGVRVALLNMDAGDLAAGDRGYGNDPDMVARWRHALVAAVDLAAAVRSPLVNVLAGRLLAGPDRVAQLDCLAANVGWAAERARHAGLTVVVEAINDRDAPGYLLPRVADVAALLDRVGHPCTGIQLDTYHVAAMGDDPVTTIAAHGAAVRHVQLADHPGRHEPGTGTIPMAGVLDALERAGYRGSLALEYLPSDDDPRPGLAALADRFPRLRPPRDPDDPPPTIPHPPDSTRPDSAPPGQRPPGQRPHPHPP